MKKMEGVEKRIEEHTHVTTKNRWLEKIMRIFVISSFTKE
jgi:hypothetical protein